MNHYPLEQLLETYQISLWWGYPEKTGQDSLGQPSFDKSSWLAESKRKKVHGDTPREAVEKLVNLLNA